MMPFSGISAYMACLGCPRIKIYRAAKKKVPIIIDFMTQNRFYRMRSLLKVINNLEVPEEGKKKDPLWKVRPVLKRVLQGCLNLPRPAKVCIDEQIVPFTGHCPVHHLFICAREVKSNRVKGVHSCESRWLSAGLQHLGKNFPTYMGKNTFTKVQQMGIGGYLVLRLTETVTRGTLVYFDRHFTTISLLDALQERVQPAT